MKKTEPSIRVDDLPASHKKVALIWIYNLISPGVWLGTIYGLGMSSLRFLAIIWLFELVFIQWGLYFILPLFFLLSLITTSAVLEKNEQLNRMETKRKKLLEKKNATEFEEIKGQSTEDYEIEKYVDLELDDIVKKPEEEDVLDYNPVSKEVRKLLKKDPEEKK